MKFFAMMNYLADLIMNAMISIVDVNARSDYIA
jgi:hypothetical protein